MLEIGNFLLGDDRTLALATFESLKETKGMNPGVAIRLDLIRKEDDALPEDIGRITCTLDQYSENCKTIMRDAFKFNALKI